MIPMRLTAYQDLDRAARDDMVLCELPGRADADGSRMIKFYIGDAGYSFETDAMVAPVWITEEQK
jgi:hypothetical protein